MRLSKTTSWRYRAGSRRTKKYGLVKGHVPKPCYVISCPSFRNYHIDNAGFWDDVDEFLGDIIGKKR